ncbi:MAG: phospholipase D-like domain-containing protein [Kouleothrix sp.]
MSRRSRLTWRISQAALLLMIVALIAGFYLYWRAPATLSQLLGALAAEPTAVSTPVPPTPPPPIRRATASPAAAPTAAPAATPGRSEALRSQTGSWYQLFFSNPRFPDKPEYHRAGIDERLVALLNSARKTIDMAIYDFDLENVANALAAAAKRGVRVRMVTDTDTLTSANPAVQRALAIVKDAGIPIVDDQRPAIMHDKFVVVDGVTIWTGSWNFTDGDTYRLNNNAIKIVSVDLAANYTREFELMFVQRLFGPAKPASLNDPVITIGGARVENYFAPEGRAAQRIVDRLQLAKQSIHFLAFSFTSDTIGRTVRQMAKAGVQVSGVFETTGSETLFSEYGKFLKVKLDVLQDGNPYPMHHKVFIIDGQTVIFGSYNFTVNADGENDENLLIVDDPKLAQAFEGEFQRVRALALAPPR